MLPPVSSARCSAIRSSGQPSILFASMISSIVLTVFIFASPSPCPNAEADPSKIVRNGLGLEQRRDDMTTLSGSSGRWGAVEPDSAPRPVVSMVVVVTPPPVRPDASRGLLLAVSMRLNVALGQLFNDIQIFLIQGGIVVNPQRHIFVRIRHLLGDVF